MENPIGLVSNPKNRKTLKRTAAPWEKFEEKLSDIAMPWEERRMIIEAQQNANRLEKERIDFDWHGGRLWPIVKAKRMDAIEPFVRKFLGAEEMEDYLVSLLVEFRLCDQDVDLAAISDSQKTIAQFAERLSLPHAAKNRLSFQESKKSVEKWKVFFERFGRLAQIPVIERIHTWLVTLCKVKQISVRQSCTVAAVSILYGLGLRLYEGDDENIDANVGNDVVDAAIGVRKKMVSLLYSTEKFNEGQIRDECPMIRLECVRFIQRCATLPCTPFGPSLWLPQVLKIIEHTIRHDPAIAVRRKALEVVEELLKERDFTTCAIDQLPDFNVIPMTLLRHAHDNDYRIQLQCIQLLSAFAQSNQIDFAACGMRFTKMEWNKTIKKLFFHRDVGISNHAMRFFDCSVFPKRLEEASTAEFHEIIIEFMGDVAEEQPYLATRLVDRTKYHNKWDWSTLVKLLQNPVEELNVEQKKKRQKTILALMDAIVRDHSDLCEVVPTLTDVLRILRMFNSDSERDALSLDEGRSFMLYTMAECALMRAFACHTLPDMTVVLKGWRDVVYRCLMEFENKESMVVASKMLEIVPRDHWKMDPSDLMARLIQSIQRELQSDKPSRMQNACRFSLAALSRFHFVPSKLLAEFDRLERSRFEAEKTLPNWYTLQFYALAALQRPERAHGIRWMMIETLASQSSNLHAKALAFQSLIAFTSFLHRNAKIHVKSKVATETVLGHAMGYFGGMAMDLPSIQIPTEDVVPAGYELGFLCDLFSHNPQRLKEQDKLRLFIIHASHILNTLEQTLSRRLAGIVLAIASNSVGLQYLGDEFVRALRKLHPKALCTVVLDALRWENTRIRVVGGTQEQNGDASESMIQISKRVASRFIFFDAQFSTAFIEVIIEALVPLAGADPTTMEWILAMRPLLNRMPKNKEFGEFLATVLKFAHVQSHERVHTFFQTFCHANFDEPELEQPREEIEIGQSSLSPRFMTPDFFNGKRARTMSPGQDMEFLPALEHSAQVNAQGSSTGSVESQYTRQARTAAMDMPASPISIEESSCDNSLPLLGATKRSMVLDLTPTQSPVPDADGSLSRKKPVSRKLDYMQDSNRGTQESTKRKPPVPAFSPESSRSPMECRTEASSQEEDTPASSKSAVNSGRRRKGGKRLKPTSQGDTDTQNSASSNPTLVGQNRLMECISPTAVPTQSSRDASGKATQNRLMECNSPTAVPTQSSRDASGKATQNRLMECISPTAVPTQSSRDASGKATQNRLMECISPTAVPTQSSRDASSKATQNRLMECISPTAVPTQSSIDKATPASADNIPTLFGQNHQLETQSPTVKTQTPKQNPVKRGLPRGNNARSAQGSLFSAMKRRKGREALISSVASRTLFTDDDTAPSLQKLVFESVDEDENCDEQSQKRSIGSPKRPVKRRKANALSSDSREGSSSTQSNRQIEEESRKSSASGSQISPMKSKTRPRKKARKS